MEHSILVLFKKICLTTSFHELLNEIVIRIRIEQALLQNTLFIESFIAILLLFAVIMEREALIMRKIAKSICFSVIF